MTRPPRPAPTDLPRMPQVKYSAPKVLVNPTAYETGSGATASITYDNPEFIAAVRQMFNCRANENITQLEFDGFRVTARLEIRNPPIPTSLPPPRKR